MKLSPTPFLSARSRRALAASLALALLLAGACSRTSAGPTPSPTPTETTTPPPPPIAPLTGLVARSRTVVRHPVLAIKIDNAPAARPQSGLDRADIVYEEPVEGGLTRFVALFHSRDASPVGPIRSARLADIDILAAYGRPILSFSGAAGYVLKALAKADLALVPHGSYGSIYRRNYSRPAPNNLYSTTQELRRAARSNNPTRARPVFTFGDIELWESPSATPTPTPTATPSGTPAPTPRYGSARRVQVSFSASTAVWEYHRRSNTYRRSHGTIPHRVASGARVTATNVVIQRVQSRIGAGPGGGAATPALTLVGSGVAFVLRDGLRIRARWSRPSLDEPTTFTDRQGRPIPLAPGNTWVELAPTSVPVSFR